ncbi:MAG: hydrogenase 3 maturation endopeptidase HyCI [Thermovirgaceae bacterium]|nr:hydrogenase 3 maturation endopeptidase HyCI [Thermovirgaceae bacterium]
MRPITVVWGVGNEMMGDDAAGIYAAELVRSKKIPWIRVFLCGTLPENYISPLEKISPGTLLIIDAADMGIKPGEIRLLKTGEIGEAAFSTHGIPIGVLLAPFEPGLRVRILAIQPLGTRLGDEISQPVRIAAEKTAGAVCDRSWGNFPQLQRENLSPR